MTTRPVKAGLQSVSANDFRNVIRELEDGNGLVPVFGCSKAQSGRKGWHSGVADDHGESRVIFDVEQAQVIRRKSSSTRRRVCEKTREPSCLHELVDLRRLGTPVVCTGPTHV